VLVELTGHTANNRLGVMAAHPAPVQATWIGYPNSTGLQAVHYRLTDAVCDPEGAQQVGWRAGGLAGCRCCRCRRRLRRALAAVFGPTRCLPPAIDTIRHAPPQAFVEALVRLPGCFLCYTPSIDAPPVSRLPAQLNGFVTFGSFNNLAKITPEVG
jgi:predicted O-linked N-acetylglucosamine transferase (SPINDLY family)